MQINTTVKLRFLINVDTKYPMFVEKDRNLKNMCRFCFVDLDTVHCLLAEDFFCGKSRQILDYFASFTDVQIFEEDYLNQTCSECLHCAKFIYRFKKQCESAEVALKEHLTKVGVVEDRPNSDSNLEDNDYQVIDECEEIDAKKSISNHSMIDENCAEDDVDLTPLVPKTKQQSNVPIVTLTRSKNILCTQCGKRFARKTDLSRHSLTHTQAKPYKCTKCPRGFNQHYAMVQHLRYHTGQSTFMCDICGKGFIRKSSLKQHINLHSGVRKHQCNVCQRSFTTNAHLNRHTRIHSGERPFKCGACGKSFTTQTGYVVHSRSHSNIKPYKCLYCDRACTTSTALKIHTRNHTGERPYKCDECEASFTRSDLRKLHMKSAHVTKPQKT